MQPGASAKGPAMPVVIEPANQLSFRRPLTRLVSENLHVTNKHPDQGVAFKVKTTAPKQYCVRPNSGKIRPGETVQIQVLLQPMKEDPPRDFRCKDKFLVQSVVIAQEQQDMAIAELWSHVESFDRDKIVEHKVRCVFLEAEDGEKAAGESRPEGSTDQASHDAPRGSGGAQKSSAMPQASSASAGKEYAYTSREEELRKHRDTPDHTYTLREEELLHKLRAAEAQILQLSKQNEIRQRRTEPSSSSRPASLSTARTATAAVAGHTQFSVEVVALVAVLSFLFGYLFF